MAVPSLIDSYHISLVLFPEPLNLQPVNSHKTWQYIRNDTMPVLTLVLETITRVKYS